MNCLNPHGFTDPGPPRGLCQPPRKWGRGDVRRGLVRGAPDPIPEAGHHRQAPTVLLLPSTATATVLLSTTTPEWTGLCLAPEAKRGVTPREVYERVARDIRFAFYKDAIQNHGPKAIMFGHHQNDIQVHAGSVLHGFLCFFFLVEVVAFKMKWTQLDHCLFYLLPPSSVVFGVLSHHVQGNPFCRS